MLRTAAIKLDLSPEQAEHLAALQAAYADACTRLVPIVREHRVWNRVALHQRAYARLRAETTLGSQMFGENTGAATRTGRVFGGEALRHRSDCSLALCRCLQSNGSQSARQRPRQVFGQEARRIRHINHETSKAIVNEARQIGAARIVLVDLTHIRNRIKAGKRMRARLHGWAWRQLQTFVEYKAKEASIAVRYVNLAYTSQTCSSCGALGKRSRHRFECPHCGLRAHSDLKKTPVGTWPGWAGLPSRQGRSSIRPMSGMDMGSS